MPQTIRPAPRHHETVPAARSSKSSRPSSAELIKFAPKFRAVASSAEEPRIPRSCAQEVACACVCEYGRAAGKKRGERALNIKHSSSTSALAPTTNASHLVAQRHPIQYDHRYETAYCGSS